MIGAFMLMAMIDSLPDPPAVNPGAAATKVQPLHISSFDTVPARSDSLVTTRPVTLDLIVAGTCGSGRHTNPLARIGQAADSSPPSQQSTGKLSFQL
jgi:hypothetical protein